MNNHVYYYYYFHVVPKHHPPQDLWLEKLLEINGLVESSSVDLNQLDEIRAVLFLPSLWVLG